MTSLSTIDQGTLAATRLFLEQVGQHFGVLDAYLFGSRARQTGRPDSDADVAVVLTGPAQDFVDVKMQMDDIAFDVLLETGIRVQPWPVWREEWDHPTAYPNPQLLSNIARDGVRL